MKNIKLLLILFSIIIFSSFVSAELLQLVDPGTCGSVTLKMGVNFNLSGDIVLNSVVKDIGTSCTKLYIYNRTVGDWSPGTELFNTTNLSGNNFSNINFTLYEHTDYDIMCDDEGASYNRCYSGGTFPITSGRLLANEGVYISSNTRFPSDNSYSLFQIEFSNVTAPISNISDSVESTAVVKQIGTVTINSPILNIVISSDFNISINQTELYGSYAFNVLPTGNNELFCELDINGTVIANVTRTLTSGFLGNVFMMSEHFNLTTGTYTQTLSCLRNGGGSYVISNAVGIGHIFLDENNETIPHDSFNMSKTVTSGQSFTKVGELNFTISNRTQGDLLKHLIIEWSGNYFNNAGSPENLTTFISINNTNCSSYIRTVSSSSSGSVSGDCLLENVTTNQTYNIKFFGNGSNSQYNINLIVKEFMLSDEEIAGGQGILVGLNFTGDTDTKLVNITGGNLNHALTNVFQKQSYSILTDEDTTVNMYITLNNSINLRTVNMTRDFQSGVIGVLIGQDVWENVPEDNYSISVFANCGSPTATCTLVGGAGIGYITDVTTTILNAFNISIFDNFDDSSILNFTVVDGVTFNSITGSLNFFTTESFVNFTVTSNFNGGYFNRSFVNWNTSNDINITLNQTLINWNCSEKVSGNDLNCTSPTESTIFNYNVIGNPHTQNINISGYFGKNITFNVTALQNETLNAIDFYSTNLTLGAFSGLGTVTNCSYNVSSLTYDWFEIVNGNPITSIGLINGSYNVTADCINFAITTETILIENITQTLNISLFTTNSINFTFVDAETLQLLSGINVTVEFIGDTAQTNITNTGFLYVDLLSPDEYTIVSSADNYRQTQYLLDLENRSTQNIIIFMQKSNNSELVLLNVKDKFQGKPLQNVNIIIQRYINNSWQTEQILKSDFQGRQEAHFVVSTEFYNFLIEINGQIFFGIINSDTNKKNIYAEDVTDGINIEVDTSPNNIIVDFQGIYNIASTLNFTNTSNTTGIFRFFFIDAGGLSQTGTLQVFRDNETLICSETVTGSTGTLFCNVNITGLAAGVHTFTAQGKINGELIQTYIARLGSDAQRSLAWGVLGYFLAFLLIIIVSTMSAKVPAMSVLFVSLTFTVLIYFEVIFKGINLGVLMLIASLGFMIARFPSKQGANA